MGSVRRRKLFRDLRATWGRMVAVQLAIAIALAGVGTALGARAVLGHEIRSSYLASQPADATLELVGGVDDKLLAELRARPEIAAADKRQMVHARVKLAPDAPWQMFVLFVAEDFADLRLNTFTSDTGAWPPPRGAILLERTAVAVMGLGGAQLAIGHAPPVGHGAAHAPPTHLILQTSHGSEQMLAIAGTVHDAGQAPNWQEHRGCGYVTTETLAQLGEPPILHELLIQFRPAPSTMADAESAAASLARWLGERGHDVHEIRVPKLRQHPHQGLMDAMQLVLLVFGLLLLVLASIVLATVLSAILARQTREIGVMKAIGARTSQIASFYSALVLVIGIAALALALPLGYLGACALIAKAAFLMNISLADPTIPWWVFLVVIALGTIVPLAVSTVPIVRAARTTVRDSLAEHTARSGFSRPSVTRMPIAVRNVLRRPARLALTMTLLAIAGTLVLTAANVGKGLSKIADTLEVGGRQDLEVRLHEPADPTRLASLAKLQSVRSLELWYATGAAIARADQPVPIVNTYPDGGHGSYLLIAPPRDRMAARLPVVSGRWLDAKDTDGVVLGRGAQHQGGRSAEVGERVTIAVGARQTTFTVVGIVEDLGGRAAYVTADAFQRATGITGVSVIRVWTDPLDDPGRGRVIADLERELAVRKLGVEYAMSTPLMRTIIDDHVALVLRGVLAMAALLSLVGFIGLGSAIAIGIAERTREIGILKAIGASDRRVFGMFVIEAVVVGVASALIAFAISLPLTAQIGSTMGSRGFLATPDFTISVTALVTWPLAMLAGSILASFIPARRAARLSVRDALGES